MQLSDVIIRKKKPDKSFSPKVLLMKKTYKLFRVPFYIEGHMKSLQYWWKKRYKDMWHLGFLFRIIA